LWVPFELGRPCGPPSDTEFQREVLLQALQMVASADSTTLQEFAIDDPRSTVEPGWQAPELDNPQTISEECAALKSYYQRSCVRHSRTSVGVAKTPINELAELFDKVFESNEFAALREDLSPRLMYRFALDDLKAYYIEAGLASEHRPASSQVYDWLWKETLLGKRMREMRKRLIESDDKKDNAIGGNFIVPHKWRD